MTRALLYILSVALLVGLVFLWTRGAQRRRFMKTFRTQQPWAAEYAEFLRLIERAYGLPRGSAQKIPATRSPMNLYLVLYPEHCIYDACENEHFLTALTRNPSVKLPDDPLSTSFAVLADCWQAP
ncbi:MAG: hypothetical protein RR982_04620 [Kiritimatiellia bacterium]